jgi:hypothetical protein
MNKFNRSVVEEALIRSSVTDKYPEQFPQDLSDGQDSVISHLIHDIFGGEILKTPKKRGWHFYNRINGERIDFTKSEKSKSANDNKFEDIPSSPDETYNYFDQEEYATFFMNFISAFEEAVGLEKYHHGLSA